MIITAYVLSIIIFFVLFTKHKKKEWGYINKEDLFFLLYGSTVWPII